MFIENDNNRTVLVLVALLLGFGVIVMAFSFADRHMGSVIAGGGWVRDISCTALGGWIASVLFALPRFVRKAKAQRVQNRMADKRTDDGTGKR